MPLYIVANLAKKIAYHIFPHDILALISVGDALPAASNGGHRWLVGTSGCALKK